MSDMVTNEAEAPYTDEQFETAMDELEREREANKAIKSAVAVIEKVDNLVNGAKTAPTHDVAATVKAKSLAQQLYQEATEKPAAGEAGTLGAKPHDIWTMDRMRSRGPATGDLYGDGEFLFTFKPVLGSVYCQERYATAREYVEGDFVSYVRTQKAYAEIIYFALQGCKWPLRETVIDPDTGEEVMEDEGVPKSVPLAITLDNVKRMDMDMLSDFLIAMKRSLEGEASTTP